MTASRSLWIILSPVLRPAPGGAAIYSDTLAKGLAHAGDDVLVLSESFPGAPEHEILATKAAGGTARAHRFLPYRAGRAEKDWLSFVAYGRANIGYLKLPSLVRKAVRAKNYISVSVLIHASFFYNRGLFEFVLPKLRAVLPRGGNLFLDVRDYRYPGRQLHRLPEFDRIITSSLGVATELSDRHPGIADRIRPIAMPFEGPPVPSDLEVEAALQKFGLLRGRFLFNPNGVSNEKLYPAMRGAMPLVRAESGYEDFVLASAGRNRDWCDADEQTDSAGLTKYLGPVSHAEVLALMRGAAATLILSDREAISRAALEAMWVGAKVVLPDLPEFRRDCSEFVCSEVTPEGICAMVTLIGERPHPRFQFERHNSSTYLPMYRELAAGD